MLNNVVVMGRLGRDPELRYTPNGTAVCSLSLAVDRDRPGADGQKATDWLDVTVWGKQAESCAQHLTKGRTISVVGRIQVRTYENQEGQKRKAWEIVAERTHWLPDGKRQGNGGAPAGGDAYSGDEDESDGDVPF